MITTLKHFQKQSNIVDLVNRRIFPGTVIIKNGKILKLIHDKDAVYDNFILPGFIDSHVHVESSMLPPTEFARLTTVHGTVATVSDPHEIGNVLGLQGVRYMIQNSRQTPFHFYFGAPSCVPATRFETSGAEINASDILELFKVDKLKYLSEVMNYPGVLNQDPEVMEKIKHAKTCGLKVDGHSPGLKKEQAKAYIAAGISTDHECYTLDEALDKLKYGMKILIREGSAAKNYEALHTLIKTHPAQVMFCSDDKHPDELVKGQINQLVKRSINEKGYDVMDVLRCACYNPILHYELDVGLLREGDSADFIIVDNLQDFNVLQNYIQGALVAENGIAKLPHIQAEIINNFTIKQKSVKDFKINIKKSETSIIQAIDGELITKRFVKELDFENPVDVGADILKLAVVCRYENKKPAIAFINGFGLKNGAIASSVAHDSHNIIAVGANDIDICNAVNKIIEAKGGISVSYDGKTEILPLPIAGLMSPDDGYSVAKHYTELDMLAKKLGTTLQSPFMTLSFMALLVIPSLKLSDEGLFDGETFKFID
jgi:adenine deaminase